MAEDRRRRFSCLAYPGTLTNETAATTIGFWARARAFFAAHGIARFTRKVADNGSNYTAVMICSRSPSLIAQGGMLLVARWSA